MASTGNSISGQGTIMKASDARMGFDVAIDFTEDLEGDIGGQTFPLPANMVADQAISLGALSSVDLIVIKTPKTILLTLTHASATVSLLPVRGYLVLQTENVTAIGVRNENAEQILVTLAATKRSTS